MAHIIDVDKLGRTIALILSLAGVFGGFAVADYRLQRAEAAQIEDRTRIIQLEANQRAMMMDVALLCADVVAKRGGNPSADCKTIGVIR